MSESNKRIFTSAGISSSLDTVLATAIGTDYNSRLSKHKKNHSILLSEKSLSNNSSKSSSGSSLTLTNNNKSSGDSNNVPSIQFPHHQFYSSQQISTSANWNNINIRSNSICSQQKVSSESCFEIWWQQFSFSNPTDVQLFHFIVIGFNWLRKQARFSRLAASTLILTREPQQQIFRYVNEKSFITNTSAKFQKILRRCLRANNRQLCREAGRTHVNSFMPAKTKFLIIHFWLDSCFFECFTRFK